MIHRILFLFITLFLISCEPSIKERIEEAYPNNQPKVLNYIQEIDGKEEVVEEKTYFENGQLKMGGKFLKGKRNGIWKAYFENGILQSEGEFENGARTGVAKVYFSDGKIRYEGQYDNDKEVGHWKFYNKEGELVTEKDF